VIVVRGNRESPRNKAMYRVGVAEQKLSGNSVIQPSVPMDTSKTFGAGDRGILWPTQSSTATDKDASSRGTGTYPYLSKVMRTRLSKMEPK
jgi:hypothetical protein